jgi:hypothetical protein
MKTIALAIMIFVVASCVNGEDPDPCGPRPQAPGWAVAFDTINGYQRALLTVEDYNAIVTWRFEITEWATCMESHYR